MTIKHAHIQQVLTVLLILTMAASVRAQGGSSTEVKFTRHDIDRSGGCEIDATIPVDPAATYLQTEAASALDAVPVDLAAACIQPGDKIRLQRLGEWDCGDPCDKGLDSLLGVFSSSATLLPQSESHRVPDAIPAGQSITTSGAGITLQGGGVTDIPEDFIIAGNTAQRADHTCLVVPEGATHLFLSVSDSVYGDNTDPDGDFAVHITPAEDCPLASRELKLTRRTIDAGGEIRSFSNFIRLSGTIGQHDPTRAEGGDIQLTGGFWVELPLGDCENDGDVDLRDHARFVDCVAGPDPAALFPDDCRCFDVNRNDTVDLLDFATVQAGFHGSAE